MHEFIHTHAYEQEAKTHKDAADVTQEKLMDSETENSELRQQVSVCIYICCAYWMRKHDIVKLIYPLNHAAETQSATDIQS